MQYFVLHAESGFKASRCLYIETGDNEKRHHHF